MESKIFYEYQHPVEAAIDAEKENYPSALTDGDVFEIFCSDNILKNFDLSFDQVSKGIVDGPHDGGIDGAYVFVNKQLIEEDTDLSAFKSPVDIEVIVIQSKHQDSFKEAAVDKLSSSLPMLLDLARPAASLVNAYDKAVIEAFSRYRDAVGKLSKQFPTIKVEIFYCSKGDAPNIAIVAKADALKASLSTLVNSAVDFSFLGSEKLYALAREQRRYVAELPTTNAPLFGTNSFVALCKLGDYAKFISSPGEPGNLMTKLFESNVRAYQGDVDVNREIAESLKDSTSGIDFWWLNNGVTIVADKAQFNNGKMTIENPLIVNGLQTSSELHKHSQTTNDQDRQIMVRIIQEADPNKRDQIIKATNRQTAIKPSSLRATESVHRRIEDYFAAHALYYDRRKNFYKNAGKPADRIVSIDKLAQAVMAVLLKRPHDARARPTTLIKNDSDYGNIFSDSEASHPLELYRVAAELLLKVETYFKSVVPRIDRRYTNNLKFHILMVSSWNILGSQSIPARGIAALDPTSVSDVVIVDSSNWAISQFEIAGPVDRVAKDGEFTKQLVAGWSKPTKAAVASTSMVTS
jgi:hypothetical protein